MKTALISEYRSHLAKYHKKILEDHEPLRIHIAGKGDVIIMPASDYENIKETIYILKDKVTMASIMKTRLEIEAKKFKGKKIEEVFTDVMESENK